MPRLPGPNEAATVALRLVYELVDRLIVKVVLTHQERDCMWADVVTRLGNNVTKLGQDNATILRERIQSHE